MMQKIQSKMNANDKHQQYIFKKLLYAVLKGNLKEVEKFIHKDFDINMQDKNANTILLYAIKNLEFSKGYKIIKTLLKAGADVSIIGQGGKSALMLAKIYEPRYIKLLKIYNAKF